MVRRTKAVNNERTKYSGKLTGGTISDQLVHHQLAVADAQAAADGFKIPSQCHTSFDSRSLS
jgi:hypothetical protein